MFTITEYRTYRAEEVLPLYAAVGWTNYTENPDMLRRALENSLLTLAAREGERLLLPFSLTVHHATVDGWQVHQFLSALQKDMDRFQDFL